MDWRNLMSRALCVSLVVASVFSFAPAQQQAPALAFSSIGLVSGVQMTGKASWHYGSDDQTGTVTLNAFASGRSSMTLQLSGGTRSETQGAFADAAGLCTWAGPDGVVHPGAEHNCWLSAVWFLPQITLQAGAGAADAVISYAPAGDGKTIIVHVERHPTAVRDSKTANLLAALSSVDLGIDSATHLPQWLRFKIHPDSDAGTNLQVEVDFSDYRTVNGVTVPFHIQKLLNHALVLDLQISDVKVQ